MKNKMYNSIKNNLLFLILPLIINSSFIIKNEPNKDLNIVKIDIYYLPLDLKTRTQVTEETIKVMKATKKITIDSIPCLLKELENIKLKEGWDSIDLRILCEIHYADSNIDQLGFDKNKLIYFNDKVYKKNRTLFNMIFKKIS
jgi:hypothetical protein